MGISLKDQLERSRVKREIAENKLRTKALNFQNENLKVTRKRKLGATSPGKAERDMPTGDRRRAMAMARQRVEENPIVQTIVNARLDNIVGTGPRLRMRSGDIAWDVEVENWWTLEQDRLDIRGLSPFGWLCRMWQARRDIDGDVGIALVGDTFDGIPVSYVQTWEADHICRDPSKPDDCGVEFDEFGMPKVYYVMSDPDDRKADPKPFKREKFILYANDNTYRANRSRGITMFLQVFAILQDHADIIEGIVQKVKNESFIGIKYWMQPGGDGNLFGSAQSTDSSEDVDFSKVEMRPGMNLVLGDGEQAEVMESKSPHAEFDAFEKKLISRIALPFGFTYELLTGDYSAVNDRTARVMLKQFEKRVKVEQAMLGMTASRIFRWALSRAVKGKVITPPDGLNTWFDHGWGWTGTPYINPLQEAQADQIRLESRLTSRTRLLLDRGEVDFDDLMDEIAYEDDAMMSRGISIEQQDSTQTGQTNQQYGN